MYDQKIGYGQGALNLDCSSVVFLLNFAGSSKTFSSVIIFFNCLNLVRIIFCLALLNGSLLLAVYVDGLKLFLS